MSIASVLGNKNEPSNTDVYDDDDDDRRSAAAYTATMRELDLFLERRTEYKGTAAVSTTHARLINLNDGVSDVD
jgi:hypothetical protein